jgi:hypothetical protein
MFLSRFLKVLQFALAVAHAVDPMKPSTLSLVSTQRFPDPLLLWAFLLLSYIEFSKNKRIPA